VELSWNHSIGQGVHKLSKEGMGVSSIVARSFLWRHAGYATDLKGWSGTPIALYSADDTNTPDLLVWRLLAATLPTSGPMWLTCAMSSMTSIG
jgi:hypothetical protein